MTESSVGISQYVDAALPAFSAIIKHRFTDFLVNEVNLAGKVIELKSIQRPPAEEVEPASVEEKPADSLTADGSLVGLLLPVTIAWPTFFCLCRMSLRQTLLLYSLFWAKTSLPN